MTEPEKIKYDLMCCLVLGGRENEKHEAMRNALMYIRDLETRELPDMKNLWVSVEERKPRPYSNVILCRKVEGFHRLGFGFMDAEGDWSGDVQGKVTHWMTLPNFPEVTKP